MDVKINGGNKLYANFSKNCDGTIYFRSSGFIQLKWEPVKINENIFIYKFNEKDLELFCQKNNYELLIERPANYLNLVKDEPLLSKEIIKISYKIPITISMCITDSGSDFYEENKNLAIINDIKTFFYEYISTRVKSHFSVLVNNKTIIIYEDEYTPRSLSFNSLGMAYLEDKYCICGMVMIIKNIIIDIFQQKNIYNCIYISANLNLSMIDLQFGSISLNFGLSDPILLDTYTKWR